MTDRTQPPAGWPGPPPGPLPGTSWPVNPGPGGAGRPAPGPEQHHAAWAPGEPRPGGFALVREEAPGDGPRPAGGPVQAQALFPGPEDQWAVLSYFGAIFLWLMPPLFIYLAKRKSSVFVRSHAAQSFNLTATGTLFAVSVGIVGALLALDSPKVALVAMIPLLLALWITMMVFLIRAASAASRGEFYEIPAWLCVPMLK